MSEDIFRLNLSGILDSLAVEKSTNYPSFSYLKDLVDDLVFLNAIGEYDALKAKLEAAEAERDAARANTANVQAELDGMARAYDVKVEALDATRADVALLRAALEHYTDSSVEEYGEWGDDGIIARYVLYPDIYPKPTEWFKALEAAQEPKP